MWCWWRVLQVRIFVCLWCSMDVVDYRCMYTHYKYNTGGVGSRVVRKLLEQGATVRALVRDVPKATELLVRV